MRTLLTLAGLVAASIAPSAARADDLVTPQARQGYFIGGGMRSGVFNMDTSAAGNLGLMQGGAFTLRLGQMATPVIGFGLSIGSGGGSNDDWTGGYGGLSLELQAVPMDNLALRAGIGLAGIGLERIDPAQKRDDDPSGGAGTLYTLGMSYDWFPWFDRAEGDRSGGVAFTPFFEASALPVDGIFAFAIFLGFEATWWSGLEDNKLDLDPEEAFVPRP